MQKHLFTIIFGISLLLILTVPNTSKAAKLVEILPVDNQCLVLHFQDGAVEYNWDDTISGSCNGWDYFHTEKWSLCPDKDQYIAFGDPLNVELAKLAGEF